MDHSHVHDEDEDPSCMMQMIFHGGHCESILFTEWTVKQMGSFIGALIGIFAVTILYEGLKYTRDILYATDAKQNRNASTGELRKRSFQEGVTNKYHIIQAILYLIQISVSYLLMLVAMIYNVWLFLAIVIGAAAGYFCFGWIKSNLRINLGQPSN